MTERGVVDASGPEGRPATSNDVARRAGVARSTVSHILNGDDQRFPDATRRRVLQAARDLDYHPSMAGRSLASGRSDNVVVLLPDNTFASELQDSVDTVVAGDPRVDWNVVVRFAGSTLKATRAAIITLRPVAVVDFGILPPKHRAWLEDRGIPITQPVLFDPDYEDGGISRLQVEVLSRYPERPLWFVEPADPRQEAYGPQRLLAMRRAAALMGLPEPRVVRAEISLDSARHALSTICSDRVPSSVACYNDDLALAILAAGRVDGVQVPADVAVVGADYTRLGQLWAPRLTTIDTDIPALIDGLSANLRALLKLPGTASTDPPRPQFQIIRGETA